MRVHSIGTYNNVGSFSHALVWEFQLSIARGTNESQSYNRIKINTQNGFTYHTNDVIITLIIPIHSVCITHIVQNFKGKFYK